MTKNISDFQAAAEKRQREKDMGQALQILKERGLEGYVENISYPNFIKLCEENDPAIPFEYNDPDVKNAHKLLIASVMDMYYQKQGQCPSITTLEKTLHKRLLGDLNDSIRMGHEFLGPHSLSERNTSTLIAFSLISFWPEQSRGGGVNIGKVMNAEINGLMNLSEDILENPSIYYSPIPTQTEKFFHLMDLRNMAKNAKDNAFVMSFLKGHLINLHLPKNTEIERNLHEIVDRALHAGSAFKENPGAP